MRRVWAVLTCFAVGHIQSHDQSVWFCARCGRTWGQP